MILSILIPTMYRRVGSLAALLRNLGGQIQVLNANETVEVLTRIDNGFDKGGESTGMKRNKLIEHASGEYVVFVDDDDDIDQFYVKEILKALEEKPDVVGIAGWITTNGANEKQWFISKDLDYCAKYDENGKEYYHRFNNHLAPIKKSIAQQIGYPDLTIGEDYNYAVRLKESGLIKTEVIIEKRLYHYKFNNQK